MTRENSKQPEASTNAASEAELYANAEAIVKAASAEPKPRPKRKATKKAKEEHPPLPDETQPAPDLPKPKRTAADYDLKDILADDSEEEELTEALPVSATITTKVRLPA
jgi:hypothetical protein